MPCNSFDTYTRTPFTGIYCSALTTDIISSISTVIVLFFSCCLLVVVITVSDDGNGGGDSGGFRQRSIVYSGEGAA